MTSMELITCRITAIVNMKNEHHDDFETDKTLHSTPLSRSDLYSEMVIL